MKIVAQGQHLGVKYRRFDNECRLPRPINYHPDATSRVALTSAKLIYLESGRRARRDAILLVAFYFGDSPMSRKLEAKVWQSDLDGTIKPLAACLADTGNDDGSSIFPSVAYLAWLLGKEPRSVQRGMKKLREMGILTVVRHAKGGSGQPTEYRLIADALPKRTTWEELRALKKKGDKMTPPAQEKGDKSDKERVTKEKERVTLFPETTTPVSPDPLEPLDPKTKEQTTGTRGCRLPEDFTLTDEMRAWAKSDTPHVNITVATDEFRDYWRGVPGSRGTKLDWPATWRNRMRELQNRVSAGGRNGSYRGRPTVTSGVVPPMPKVKTGPLPAGVSKWNCSRCDFAVVQNANGLKKCPDCGAALGIVL